MVCPKRTPLLMCDVANYSCRGRKLVSGLDQGEDVAFHFGEKRGFFVTYMRDDSNGACGGAEEQTGTDWRGGPWIRDQRFWEMEQESGWGECVNL